MKGKEEGRGRLSASASMGVIALVFLAIGWQTALFVHKAATAKVLADRDSPDTIYVYGPRTSPESGTSPSDGQGASTSAGARTSQTYSRVRPERPEKVEKARQKYTPRTYESFPFDPNTVSIEDLMRLGFTQRQAESIDNYRRSGGHFSRAADFAKSYVVADSVFRRLEPFISIPKVDLNTADSAAFDALPGIGPYYASRMVSFRKELGGYSYPQQLMDIYRFDKERFDGLSDLIEISPCKPYALWTLEEDSLALHPYIGRHSAHGIVLFRDNNPKEALTVEALVRAGVLDQENGEKLSKCRIEEPQ